eukprot:2258476-Rhodomonas_salina.1
MAAFSRRTGHHRRRDPFCQTPFLPPLTPSLQFLSARPTQVGHSLNCPPLPERVPSVGRNPSVTDTSAHRGIHLAPHLAISHAIPRPCLVCVSIVENHCSCLSMVLIHCTVLLAPSTKREARWYHGVERKVVMAEGNRFEAAMPASRRSHPHALAKIVMVCAVAAFAAVIMLSGDGS